MSQTDIDAIHINLYSRHSQNHVENVSVELYTIMTRLGYGEEIRRWRVEKYREHDRLKNARPSNLTVITAGSKAEGLTCLFESDRDFLYVLKRVRCVEAGINLHTIPDDIDVFRMDTCVYPGHCRLLQERPATNRYEAITNALCDNGYGNKLLSSSLLIDYQSAQTLTNSLGLVQHERAGPSVPGTVIGVYHMDIVLSLPCHCPFILHRWAARPRHWPQPVIIQKVVSLGSNLTPVGFKGSECKHMEWRICFNAGETELINNLNDTQTKVYVLLKMILKHVLRPCKKEITSYVMKNIVLWQAESNPQSMFYSRSLFYWLHDGLRELRTAIVTKQLSYYMIPERNLMAVSGLHDEQQSKLVTDITDMMAEGPRLILRLPKIRQAVVASPEPMLWFSKKRMELEMLWLETSNRAAQCNDENGVVDKSDAILEELWRRQEQILVEVEQRMLEEDCAVNDLCDILNRIVM